MEYVFMIYMTCDRWSWKGNPIEFGNELDL
jgi:hypothetical protein